MEPCEILKLLPYAPPFLFVEELQEVNDNGARGSYTFPAGSFFYEGHFKDNPVTPGVILSECMAQIGVVSLGIFLLKEESFEDHSLGLSNIQMDFYLPVFPGEKVQVISEKIFFRFNKLKCSVEMKNQKGKLVCKGEISGMIVRK